MCRRLSRHTSQLQRGRSKRADYPLRYRPNVMLAVVEAKAAHKTPGDGLQQARESAQILDLK
jgi:type I restriction enzyme, R subunit